MQSITRDLSIRSEELNSILEFLNLMESGGFEYKREFNNSTTVKTSIKAGIVLMLYNAVESTVTKSLERLHETLIRQKLMFDDCNEKLKQLIIIYYENAKEKNLDVQNKAPYILRFYDYIQQNRSFELSYKDLSKFYSLYSGNLDSREIISVLNKYGMDFQVRITELKTIKNKRNELAHGELTFEEVGRALSVQQLMSMKERTFDYLEKIIDEIEIFIENEKYKSDC